MISQHDHALLEMIVGDHRRRHAERRDHHRGVGEKTAGLVVENLKAEADRIGAERAVPVHRKMIGVVRNALLRPTARHRPV